MSVINGLSDLTCVSLIATATKADGFELYFLGECNNVSAEDMW